MGGLDTAAARQASSRFESMLGESFVILLPNRDDFNIAKDWLGHFETGLRSGDALHLAIAGNNGANAIHSLDKRMIAAGRMLGMPTSVGGFLSGYDN